MSIGNGRMLGWVTLAVSLVTGILTYAVTVSSMYFDVTRRLDRVDQRLEDQIERAQDEHNRQWQVILETRRLADEMRRELDQRR